MRYSKPIRALTVAGALALATIAGNASAKDCKAKSSAAMSEGTYRALERIHEMISENSYKEAEERLTRMLDRGSDYEKAVVNQTLGFVYIQQEDYKRGLAAFERALAYDALPVQQQEQLQYNTGQLYIADGRYDKGIRTLEAYIAEACEPVPAEAHIQLAAAYAERKEYRKALKQVDLAIAKSEKPQETWYQLKLALHYELQEYKACADVLLILVSLVPDKPEYWKQLQGIYFEIKQDREALAALSIAHRNGLLAKESDFKNLASIFMLLDIPLRAAEVMTEGLEKNIVEKTQRNYEFLSDAWLLARELDEAIAAQQRAAEIAGDGKVWMRLAQMLAQEERWKAAIEAVDKALQAGLENAGPAYMVKGQAAFNLGQPKTAIAAFNQAKRYEKTRKQAAQWIEFVRSETVASVATGGDTASN